jgi:predicted glycoside hydrolase/deacetylase ChbG (UPF0249 family)
MRKLFTYVANRRKLLFLYMLSLWFVFAWGLLIWEIPNEIYVAEGDKLSIEDVLERTTDAKDHTISLETTLVQTEAIQALVALGYGNTESMKAVKKVEISENATVEDVEKEMRAQIELAMKYIDNVTHITDHCMWTMRPDLKELAIRVAQDYGLRYQGQGDYDAQIGIQSLPMGFGRGPRAARLLEALKKMEKGKTYWTIEHPSLDNEEMKGIYEVRANGQKSYAGPDRQDVTNAFTDPEVMKYIKENGIELVSFGDVIREHAAKK